MGIAQACTALGHRCVFLRDPGFAGVFEGYGFEEREVNLSEPMAPEEMARYWADFINGHIPNFNRTPYEQIDNYVKECWEAIVETSKWAEKDLPRVLGELAPDLICIDNVVLFPAAKRYGVPWVRIISCSENEIPDPDIPPHLSGCGEHDEEGFEKYRNRFNEVIRPIHDDFNAFLEECGEAPYAIGEFFEASPRLNLLLYPEPVKYRRRHALDEERFQYLEGCVRKDEPYEMPAFETNHDEPVIYLSFGSLGSGDTALLKRMLTTLGKLPYRVLANVGDYEAEYADFDLPANVKTASWYPQPSVIPQVDAVIPSRRQQQLHRVSLLRQAGVDHALRLGRTRQRHPGAGNQSWPQDAPRRLEGRRSGGRARYSDQRSLDAREARRHQRPHAVSGRHAEGGTPPGRIVAVAQVRPTVLAVVEPVDSRSPPSRGRASWE